MNTLVNQLEYMAWKLSWADSKWKCGYTGKEFTLPTEVRKGDFYKFGESYVDLGNEAYSRFGGNPILVEAPHKKLAEQIREHIEALKKEEEDV